MEQIGLEGVFDLKSFNNGIDSYLKGVSKAEKETDGFGKKLGKAYDDMGKSVLNAGKIMGTAVVGGAVAATAAVGAFVATGINQAKDLESQLGGIAAVLSKTKDEVEPLKELIFDLGIDPTLKVNAQEAANAIELLARNGLSMDQIMAGAAKSTVLLANATGADFGTAADISTDAMAIFKIRAEDMITAVDGITSVTTASKFSINDYALALAQGGGVAGAVGVSFDDFNTTIAGISPLFKSGSDAGTSFKTFLQRLIPQSTKAVESMRDIGLTTINTGAAMEYLANKGVKPVSDDMYELYNQAVDVFYATNNLEMGSEEAAKKFSKWATETGLVQSAFFDANGQMKDMDEIASILNDSLSGLSEMEKNKALATIFGTDAMRSAVGLAEQGEIAYTDQALAAKELGVSFDSLTEAMEGGLTKFEALQIKMGQTSAAESAKTRMDNFAGALEILQGIIDTISLRIGFAFLPMLTAITRRISELIDKHADSIVAFFDNMAKGIEALVNGADWRTVFPPWLTKTIDLVAKNMDILSGALGGIAVLLASAAIGPAFAAIGAAMATLLSPMALLIFGAAALGAAWNTNFLGIKDATLAVLDPITNYIGAVADAGIVSDEARQALTLFPEALQPIIGGFMDTIAGIRGYISAVNDAGVGSIEAQEALTLFPESLRGIAQASLSTILGLWAYGGAIRDAGVFSVEAREALTLLPKPIQGIVGGFAETLGAIGNYVSAIADAGLNSDEARQALGLLKASFGKLVSALSEQLPIWKNALLEWGTAAWQWIVDASAVVGTKLAEWATTVVTTLAANLPWLLATMLSWSATLVSWIGLAIAGSILKLGEWATALVTWLTGEGATQLGTGTGGLVSALIDWIVNDLIPKVAPEMGKFLVALGGALLNIAGALGIAALSIGAAIWNGIMAIDWKAVGSGILTLIQSGWELAKATVLPAIGAVATSLKDKFNEIDWKAVGSGALTLVKDGWEFAKGTVLPAIGTIATSLKTKFNETDWKAVGTDTATAIKDGLKTAAELVSGLIAAAGTIATAVKDEFTDKSWTEIGQGIANDVKSGIKTAADAANGLIAQMGTMANDMGEKLAEIDWNQVGHLIAQAIKAGIKTAADMVGGLLAVVGEIAADMLEKFTAGDWSGIGTIIMDTLKAAIETAAYAAAGLIYIVSEIAVGMLEEFTGLDMDTAGQDLMNALRDAIDKVARAAGGLLTKVGTLATDMLAKFTDIDWTAIGKGIIDGIKKGIDDAKQGLIDKAKSIADGLPGWVKEVLGIGSPSKVFAEIGRDIVRGLIVGIDSQVGALKDTVTGLFSAMAPSEFLSLNLNPTTAFSDRLADMVDPLREALTGITSQRETLFGEILNLQQLREAARVAQDFNRANEIFYELQTAYANYNNLTQEQIRLQTELSKLGGQNDLDRIAFNNEQISFLTDQIALMQQAASLGVDLGGFAVGDTDIANLRKMVALEERISTAKLAQLMNQASLMKEQVKFNRLVGERFVNASAEGNWAQRFREQVVQPFMAAMDVAGVRGSAQRLLNLNVVQNSVSFLKEQISLLKQAADVGLDLNKIFPNSLIGNTQAAGQMLDIVQQITSATEQSLKNEILQIKQMQQEALVEEKRLAGLESAMQTLQPFLDRADVTSAIGQRYKAQVLDPILAQLEKAAGVDSERVRLINEYVAASQKLVAIQQKERQLEFLEQQLDLMQKVRDMDLEPDKVFAGLTLGLNASLDDLLIATDRVITAMIAEAEEGLEIESPSKVFMRIGSQMMNGLAQGIATHVTGPVNALRQSTMAHGAMSTRTLNFAMGGVTINTPMDEVMFERRVQRVMERSFA